MRTPAQGELWTEKEIDKLKWLMTRKLSFSNMAERLGKTRNAVAGKVRRLRGYVRRKAKAQ